LICFVLREERVFKKKHPLCAESKGPSLQNEASRARATRRSSDFVGVPCDLKKGFNLLTAS